MSKLKTFVRLMKNNREDILSAVMQNFTLLTISHILPDKMYIGLQYYCCFKKKINWEKPERFNEKLQWLKINDRNQAYINLVDKYEVKNIVREKIGDEYIIPTLGVWEKFEDIDFQKLPTSFVLKCTHDSRSVVICKNKKEFDIEMARKKLNACLKKNLFWHGREWPYKFVKPRIIAEKYLENGGKELSDYKVHNFNGIPEMILVCQDRFNESGLTEDFFDINWEHLDISRKGAPQSELQIPKPDLLPQIIELSKILSENIPFCRTDFYIVENRVYFGEITFYPASGYEPFLPDIWDKKIGEWLSIPNK